MEVNALKDEIKILKKRKPKTKIYNLENSFGISQGRETKIQANKLCLQRLLRSFENCRY